MNQWRGLAEMSGSDFGKVSLAAFFPGKKVALMFAAANSCRLQAGGFAETKKLLLQK